MLIWLTLFSQSGYATSVCVCLQVEGVLFLCVHSSALRVGLWRVLKKQNKKHHGGLC